jgi:hypothetical protein
MPFDRRRQNGEIDNVVVANMADGNLKVDQGSMYVVAESLIRNKKALFSLRETAM